jgi:cytochrome c biogenesis protein CcdA
MNLKTINKRGVAFIYFASSTRIHPQMLLGDYEESLYLQNGNYLKKLNKEEDCSMRFVVQRNVLILLLILLAMTQIAFATQNSHRVKIYYNGQCPICVHYMNSLKSDFNSDGITTVASYDYSTNSTSFRELNDLREKLGVPPELFGPVTTVIDKKYIFEGYLQVNLMVDFLNSNQNLGRLIVAQGLGPDSYRLYENGVVLECKSSQGISDCMSSQRLFALPGMWALVLTSGLVDGLNPCAFAVLAYFVGVVSLQRSRQDVLKISAAYVLSVYLVYFAIGLGLMHLIQAGGFIQILARILGALIAAIGIASIATSIRSTTRFSLRMPTRLFLPIANRFSISWIQKSATMAALLFGGMVAAIEFPCTGAIYTAIVGILSTQKMNWIFLSYLLGYNVMFIMPLVILLLFLCNVANFPSLKNTIAKRKHFVMRLIRLVMGLVMLGLGIILVLR